MSELTIIIKYKVISKSAVILLCLFFMLLEITLMAWCAYCYYNGSKNYSLNLALAYIGAGVFTFVPVAIVGFFREGGNLLANSDGLSLPTSLWGFGWNGSIHWQDLDEIDIDVREDGKKLFLMRTADGRRIKLDMSASSLDDIERLLLAIDLWRTDLIWSDRAMAYKDALQIDYGKGGFSSYTQIWESELRKRYQQTTFVPHEPGTKISDTLTIVKQLAFGGFSAIYLAENESHQNVVLKQLAVRYVDDAQRAKAVELFEREAKILLKLDYHPIAKVLDYFVKEGDPYMVIEYIDGENLRELIRSKGPQSELLVWTWAIQIVMSHGILPIMNHASLPDRSLIFSNQD
jgi:hypothetical protein